MKRKSLLIFFLFVLVSACGPSPEEQAAMTATAQTTTAAMWTKTPTPTLTFTPTYTFTPTDTSTPTPTFTPAITFTPTITPSPTFDFPDVTVNVAMASCRFGPSVEYMHQYDLVQGDNGVVWGRAPVGTWLYVKMDRWNGPCWLSPYVVDVVGNVNAIRVERVRLPITNALYGPPQQVEAVRRGDEVMVSWDEVWMTEEDDRGYFLNVWVCQDGNYVWMPKGLPDQYHTSYTFTDQPGCSQPSGGKLYTVEKHGYTDPVDIPWPDK